MLLELRNQGVGAVACDKDSVENVDVGQDLWEGSSAGGGGASEVVDTARSGR